MNNSYDLADVALGICFIIVLCGLAVVAHALRSIGFAP